MFAFGCWYYVADYVPMPDGPGFTPALPDDTPFVLLAGPRDQPTWGIFACSTEVDSSERVQPVSADIESILESGRRYPPALALARNDASVLPGSPSMSRHDFAGRYAQRVVYHLSRHPEAPYLIAEAVVDEPGYLSRGQRYWVLRYLRGANEVRWVSDDFQIYQNAASDFRLTANQLADLLLPFEAAG